MRSCSTRGSCPIRPELIIHGDHRVGTARAITALDCPTEAVLLLSHRAPWSVQQPAIAAAVVSSFTSDHPASYTVDPNSDYAFTESPMHFRSRIRGEELSSGGARSLFVGMPHLSSPAPNSEAMMTIIHNVAVHKDGQVGEVEDSTRQCRSKSRGRTPSSRRRPPSSWMPTKGEEGQRVHGQEG